MRRVIAGVFFVVAVLAGRAEAGTPTVIDLVAGSGPDPVATVAKQLSILSPQGVAMDGAGNLLVATQGDSVIRSIDSSGNSSIVAGTIFTSGFFGDGGPATGAILAFPTGVAVDGAGNMYIADSGNACVRIVSGGIINTFAGVGANPGNDGDSGPAASAHLTQPWALVVSGSTLYIADAGAHVIRAVDLSSPPFVITTVAGTGVKGFSGDGGNPTLAQLNSPLGIAIDPVNPNFLFIGDTFNNVVRLVDLSIPTISTFAGSGLPGLSGFNGDGGAAINANLLLPQGVLVDNTGSAGIPGNVFIAEPDNHVIRVVNGGIISRFAGNGVEFNYGDGDDPTSVGLGKPVSFVFDSSFTNFYIADNSPFANVVRVIGPDIPPTITSGNSATATEGVQSTAYTVTATGTTNILYSSTPFPAGTGLALIGSPPNPQSVATIEGNPTIADLKASPIGITLTPKNGPAQIVSGATKLVTVTILPRLPVFTSASSATGTDGTPFTFTVTATGTADLANPINFSALSLPPGFTLKQTTFNSATITGTPTASEVGLTNITIIATGLSLPATTQNLALTINAIPPTFTIPAVASGVQFLPFSFVLTAGGSPPTTFTATGLPPGLSLTGATISGVPTAIGSTVATITATNAGGTQTTALRINIAQPTIPTSNAFTVTIDASQNPAQTGTPVTFTATSTDPTAAFLWNFGDGTFTGGNPVQHAFAAESSYSVTAIGITATTSATAELEFSALAPIVPGAANISDGKPPVVNPLIGISIAVSRSDGGVIELTIDPGQAGREIFDAVTAFDEIPGRSAVVVGFTPVHKFVTPGIYVATVTIVDKGTRVPKGKMRKTLIISAFETGVAVARGVDPLAAKPKTPKTPRPPKPPKPVIPPPNIGDVLFTSLKGKFLFLSNAPDTVEFEGSIQLPAGVDTAQPQSVSLAIGNVVENFTVDASGRATSAGQFNRIKKFQIKYPKSGAKNSSNVARIQAILQTPDMDAIGFDTEGVVKGTPAAPQRSIQVGLLYAGTSYELRAPVAYLPSTKGDSATIGGRSSN